MQKTQCFTVYFHLDCKTGVLLLLHPKLVVLVLVTTVLVTGTARTGTGATTAREGRLNAEARPEPIPRPAPRPLAANFAVIFSTRLGAGAASEVKERRVAARRRETSKPMCFISKTSCLSAALATGFSERPLLILYFPLYRYSVMCILASMHCC